VIAPLKDFNAYLCSHAMNLVFDRLVKDRLNRPRLLKDIAEPEREPTLTECSEERIAFVHFDTPDAGNAYQEQTGAFGPLVGLPRYKCGALALLIDRAPNDQPLS
jgi:hypothetical protein